jgi:uncharacterized protein DUF4345
MSTPGKKIKRLALQILLGLAGLLSLVRFGTPALIFGATGPGPFGNRWLAEGVSATLLLDGDLRFFGAIMIGVGVLFFWTIFKIEALGSVIYILACGVELGALARIYARVVYGNPGTAGMIPIFIETVIPVLIVLLRFYIGRDIKKALKHETNKIHEAS